MPPRTTDNATTFNREVSRWRLLEVGNEKAEYYAA